jgi:sporulation protein YlmC with PRC-barrel domain
MLVAVSALRNYQIQGTDGGIGTVSDILFDDRNWTARWVVANTGTWLSERKVVIHPSAIAIVDHEDDALIVRLTKAQIEGSPNLLEHQPLSQQMETSVAGYYGVPPFFGDFSSMGALASPFSQPPTFGASDYRESERTEPGLDHKDFHLRSVASITGYHIHATDGAIGHVENFLIDDERWDIRYLIVDTKNWWPGQRVLIAPSAVEAVIWSVRQMSLDISMEAVKTSPPWNPATMVDEVYEQKLRHHYGWANHNL